MKISGTFVTVFVDTGSEVTIIKEEARHRMDLGRLCHRSRALRGVGGMHLDTLGEADAAFELSPVLKVIHRLVIVDKLTFPGDILLGMDFLRRMRHELIYNLLPEKSTLNIAGVAFPVTYCDNKSLCIAPVYSKVHDVADVSSLHRVPETTTEGGVKLHVYRSNVIPPYSAKFVQTRVPTTFKDGDQVLLQPQQHPLLIPHAVERVRGNFVRVLVTNVSRQPFRLTNGTCLAIAEAVEDQQVVDIASVQEGGGSTLDEVNLTHLCAERQKEVRGILQGFPQLFQKTGKLGMVPNVTHKIVTGDHPPVVTRQWRLPHFARETIRKECDEMLRNDIIEHSNSPWLSPVVLVRKKDNTVRFCCDFRILNSITTPDVHPIPRMEELLDDLSGGRYFTVLDSRSAYWTIPVDPEDRPKTAFTDGQRLFQWKRMPFGLSTAPSTFQRTMNFVLSSVLGKHTLAYLDDVVIYSKTFSEHLIQVQETLKLLSNAGFTLNAAKCDFAVQEFKFLGFVVSKEGIRPDPEKVKAIEQIPPPRNVKDVRRFLGAMGFFRRHIPKFAHVSSPLTFLTKAKVPFHWSDKEQAAFCRLKELLTTAPVLKSPDYTRHFEVHTDASQCALGGVLLQRDDSDRPHAIAYFSRKVRGSEVRYTVTDLEALAVVESIRVFDPYLYGRPFTVVTDHKPLTYIFSRKTKSPRMSRFSHELSYYTYKIVYKKGANHHVPDLLSRSVAPVDLATQNPAILREEQLKDPHLAALIRFLDGDQGPPQDRPAAPLDDFALRDGVLYKLNVLPERIIYKLYIPRHLRGKAVKMAHATPIAGHPGIHRTFCKVRDLFFFPNMIEAVRLFVKSCPQCQLRKGPANPRAPIAGAAPAEHPQQRVQADLTELPRSTDGYKYVLTLIDEMSRFVQLVPLQVYSSYIVADAIVDNWITIFGPPAVLQTDNAAYFTSEMFQDVCKLIHTKTMLTTPYRPQANGLVERTNRVLKDALATLCEERPEDWPQYLPYVRLSMNTAVHRSIGDQPLYVFTGGNVHLPIGLTNLTIISRGSADDYRKGLTLARRCAVEASSRARARWTADHDRHSQPVRPYAQGGLVKIRKQMQAGLQNRWFGPARLLSKAGPQTWRVRLLHAAPHLQERRVHVNDLRPYFPRDEVEFGDDPDDPDELAEPEDPDGPEEPPEDPDAALDIAILAAVHPSLS